MRIISWVIITMLGYTPIGKAMMLRVPSQQAMGGFGGVLLEKQKPIRRLFDEGEDEKLKALVSKYGTENWKIIAREMRGRTARQCRERWRNYLKPGIDLTDWTEAEDALLLKKHEEFGTRWSAISQFFPNRTPGNIRNRFARVSAINQRIEKYNRAKQVEKEATNPERNAETIGGLVVSGDEEDEFFFYL